MHRTLVVLAIPTPVLDGVDALGNPGGGAVSPINFALEIGHAARRPQQTEHFVPSFGMHLNGAAEIRGGPDEILRRTIAVDPGGGWIGVQVSAFAIDLKNSFGDIFEDAAIVFLGRTQAVQRVIEFRGGQFGLGHFGEVAQGSTVFVTEGMPDAVRDTKRPQRMSFRR